MMSVDIAINWDIGKIVVHNIEKNQEGEDIVQVHLQVLHQVKDIEGKKGVIKEDIEDHLLLKAIQEVHRVQVHLPHLIEAVIKNREEGGEVMM